MSSSAELPFVVAPPGTLESARRSAQAAAAHWALGEPTLVRMGMNAIFAAGDDVLLRVSHPTATPDQAIWLERWLTDAGVRVPTHVRDDPYVTDEHAVFAVGRITSSGAVDWVEVGAMVSRLHELDPTEVRGRYPLPFCGDFPWWSFAAMMDEAGDDLDPRSRRAIQAAIHRDLPLLEAQRPGHAVVCHGDVHPGNVLQSDAGPVLLDWDLLCHGPAAWDHAPLMTWTGRWGGAAGIYESFAEGYGRSMRGDELAEAIAELRLVAATLMRLRAGRTNPAADEEAQLRLRYWRGEADAPQWNAQ